MQKFFIALGLLLGLAGCVHKMNIEQGNIINQQMVNRVHAGMSRSDVTAIMGNPVLTNTFADNRMDYVYSYRPGYGTTTEKYITFSFRGDRLVSRSGNMDLR